MVKIKISYKGETRTFYTRKDWKDGKKLYLRHHRSKKLTGNWYTDPNYQTYSWQDYERMYAEQESNNDGEELSDIVKEMKMLVEKHNDKILKLINEKGIEELKLEEIL